MEFFRLNKLRQLDLIIIIIIEKKENALSAKHWKPKIRLSAARLLIIKRLSISNFGTAAAAKSKKAEYHRTEYTERRVVQKRKKIFFILF